MAPLVGIGLGILLLLFAPQIARMRAAEFRRVWSRELPGERFTVHTARLVGAGFIVVSSVQLWRNLHN
jgi:hypothetical protein